MVPAKVSAELEASDDVDWFEVQTATENQMIDIVFSSATPTNVNATWQVEWFGPNCGSSAGDVTLSRRNISADASPFTYSIPACKAASYKVEVRSSDPGRSLLRQRYLFFVFELLKLVESPALVGWSVKRETHSGSAFVLDRDINIKPPSA
jgi:hypothetical protein